jgi:hypothetical protein
LSRLCSQSARDFDDTDMSHKMDEFLRTIRLPANIDVVSDSMSDSEAPPTPHPPHFPYENADIMTIFGSVSIIT